MLKTNKTTDGVNIAVLKPFSKRKVVKICDKCGTEKISSYADSVKQKNNLIRLGVPFEHLCRNCSFKELPSPAKNKRHSLSIRLRLSEIAKERLKNIENKQHLLDRNGEANPNWISGIRVNTSGYAVRRVLGKEIPLHREKYEKNHGVELSRYEHIHHLDGNKLNNSQVNLVKLSNKEHKEAHWSLENAAFELFNSGVIVFDFNTKKYKVSSKYVDRLLPVSLGFDDVAIAQNKNILESRLDVDVSSEVIKGIKLAVPLIASNMLSVCNSDFCILLRKHGALGVLHRAAPDDFLIQSTKSIAQHCDIVAVSVGIGSNQVDLSKKLIKAGANVVFIDIAHGYSDAVLQTCKYIKSFSRHTKVVIGNTINEKMMFDYGRFSDAIKVGIAQGLACETKNTAGCTEGMFSSILKFKDISRDFGIPVISDGGVREPSHVVKAIGAGANSVMMGSVFCRCPESAGEVVVVDETKKKLYAGMASRYVQDVWKGGLKPGTCPEGKIVYLDIGEPLQKLIERYTGALKSGITYAGACDIHTFQDNVKFTRISSNARNF